MANPPAKQFISPSDLRLDSFKLGSKVVLSGFKPDFLVAIWRGGAPIGCYVHEFLKKCGMTVDHIAIRTSRYTGIDKTSESGKIEVHNLGYLVERLTPESKILVIDDVWDTGLSIQAFKSALHDKLGEKCPTDIRVATIHFKPKRNKTDQKPDYFVHETDAWLVYPHELEGLSLEEINRFFGGEVLDLILMCKTAMVTEELKLKN
jgi:uncharacterized protein